MAGAVIFTEIASDAVFLTADDKPTPRNSAPVMVERANAQLKTVHSEYDRWDFVPAMASNATQDCVKKLVAANQRNRTVFVSAMEAVDGASSMDVESLLELEDSVVAIAE
ncbi:hypothetical protein AC1031_007964 [Aphanomyces cochlioides]|nr:hypothetical protein AC1031_007964 [Aphanomyces cochlioides]